MGQNTCIELSDEALTDARKIRDLLAGAAATAKPELMKGAVLEASAIAGTLIDALERFFVVEAERLRERRVVAGAGGAR